MTATGYLCPDCRLVGTEDIRDEPSRFKPQSDLGAPAHYAINDRVQLVVGSKPTGYVKAHVFPGLLCVVFDRKDTLGRKQWLCEPRELEPAMIGKTSGRIVAYYPDTRKGAV